MARGLIHLLIFGSGNSGCSFCPKLMVVVALDGQRVFVVSGEGCVLCVRKDRKQRQGQLCCVCEVGVNRYTKGFATARRLSS